MAAWASECGSRGSCFTRASVLCACELETLALAVGKVTAAASGGSAADIGPASAMRGSVFRGYGGQTDWRPGVEGPAVGVGGGSGAVVAHSRPVAEAFLATGASDRSI